jgi:hypothetical protein
MVKFDRFCALFLEEFPLKPNMRLRLSLAAGFLLFCGSARAADGVLIAERTTLGGAAQTHQIQIERTRIRTEMSGDSRRVVIFDGGKQVLWMLDPDKQTYNELTKADFERIGAQMQSAMAMMQSQLANMPPAQRAQIEAMMKGRGMPGAAPVKTEYRKVGTDKVGKWTCEKYDGFQNDQKTSEICTVDPSALGLSQADFEVTRQLAEFFKKMIPQNADQLFTLGKAEDQGFNGIPVRRKSTVAGKETIFEITDVSRQSFPDASFAVPAGFTKQDFLAGVGRGRGRQ